MSKLTIDECNRIIMQGKKQLTKELREAAFSIQGNLGRCLYRRKHLDEMRKVSDLLFEAADTIESLRNRLQETGSVDAERDAAFANAIRRIVEKNTDFSIVDIEESHRQADELLCDLLLSHGYIETVDEFKSMRKWYG